MSCSRPGGLPANLQGVWNKDTFSFAQRLPLEHQHPDELLASGADRIGGMPCSFFDFITAQAPVYRKNMQTDPEMVKSFPNHRGWTLRTESGVFGALVLGAEYPCQRLVLPPSLAALRVRSGSPVPARSGLPDDEKRLRVLDRPSDHHARRTAGHPRRLVSRARPARTGRDLRPGTHLGPL